MGFRKNTPNGEDEINEEELEKAGGGAVIEIKGAKTVIGAVEELTKTPLEKNETKPQ